MQEKNATKYLTMFSDEQAISRSEIELARKIYSLLRLKEAYTAHRIFYINFDASGWNNKFRNGTVANVMHHILDKIFDMPIFSKTHKHYEKSLVYIPDDRYELWWEGQMRGIEGLNEDTWMITYLGQIKYAFQGLVGKFHLLAKKNDLRAAIPIRVALLDSEEASKTSGDLKTRHCDAEKQFGHYIKIQESYISENLFTFSKSVHFKHVPLSYSFRKIQKTPRESNTFLPVLDDYVAGILPTSVVIPQYAIALFWLSVHLNTYGY